MAWYDIVASPVGPLFVGGSAAGVHRVDFMDDTHTEAACASKLARDAGEPAGRDAAAAGAATAALRRYFEGSARTFDLEFAPRGSEFQQRVWRALLDIPFGGTASYSAIARAAGYPGAARAVGGAVGRNPLAVVVPCHRVIGSAGTLTGYGGGLERKRWLLSHEGVVLAEPRPVRRSA